MHSTYDHLVLTGSISIDRIMNFKGRYKDMIQPDKLHVLSLSILIDQLTNSRGGTAGNIAYNLALLGEKPTLLGSVGTDASDYIRALSDLGIDTSAIHRSHLPTPTFTVMTDQDDNQIGGFYPGAMAEISHLTLKPWYDTKTLVIISANDPTAMDQLVSECLAHHLPYVYDLGQQVTNITVDQLKHGLSGAKIIFVNDYELGATLSRSGYTQSQLSQMIPLIVTTLGAQGTSITGSAISTPILVPAHKNIKVIDPTGAGDSYRAGFLYGYLRDYDLSTCAQLGSTTAAFAIAQHGTQNHHFTLADIKEKLYTAYGAKI